MPEPHRFFLYKHYLISNQNPFSIDKLGAGDRINLKLILKSLFFGFQKFPHKFG